MISAIAVKVIMVALGAIVGLVVGTFIAIVSGITPIC